MSEVESEPCWIDKRFLSEVLQGVDITNFSITSTAGPGVNYYSHLYRVRVHQRSSTSSKDETVALIIKAPLEAGFLCGLQEFYAKEPAVYKHLLPKMAEKININFGPKSFYCPRKNTLALEDVASVGYTMMDKYEQLDYPHCKRVLESLAQFHATSVVCCREDPQLLETVAEESAYRSDRVSAVGTPQWASLCMRHFADVVSGLNVRKATLEHISSRVDHVWETAMRMCRPREEGLNVLNHGDCWTNNLLFMQDQSGEVVDVKFIDFQLLRFSSPLLDLITFIYTSANRDVRRNKLNTLFEVYLKSINNTFEELGCEERLTSEELFRTMKDYSDWIIIVLSFDFPFFLSSSDDAIDFQNVTMEEIELKLNDTNFKGLHNGQFYREVLPDLLEMFETVLYSDKKE